jgi:hypothetical protein
MPSQLPLGSPAALAGLTLLRHPIYLADVIGLGLLLVATLAIWVVAIAWELRRLRAR